ncbi:MAG: hypothetical protein ABEJ87_02835 [Candidatus Nanohalobium sp.]
MLEGTGLAVHGYGRYVDEEAFRDAGVELSGEMAVYGVKASNFSDDLIGGFYEDTFSDIPGGRNGLWVPVFLRIWRGLSTFLVVLLASVCLVRSTPS